jgi:hypothetical protein
MGTSVLLKTNHLVALLNQGIEINLLGPAMVSVLHTVEIKEFASGMQHSFGEGKEFSLVVEGVFF